MHDPMSTYELTQPWVLYHYGRTHDRWWPFWNSTRVLGRFKLGVECTVCGDRRILTIRIPRFGEVPEPEGGRHPARVAYLAEHAHPDRGAPMSWARPMANPAVFEGGIPLDALAMRLEADLNEAQEKREEQDR